MRIAKYSFLLSAVSVGVFCMGAGCSGTGSVVSGPQLAQPSLPGANNTVRGGDRAATAKEALLAPLDAVKTPEGTFFAAPYLQMGVDGGASGLDVVWQTADGEKAAATWRVEIRPSGSGAWQKVTEKISGRAVGVPGVPPHHVWTQTLQKLAPGALFDYRVLKGDAPVFAARARARRAPGAGAQRFVVFGDCAAGTAAQRKIAYQTSLAKPDFVFVTGDIVYGHGEASEYQANFFPVYNAQTEGAKTGASLLRSTLMIAAPGNHDTEYRDMAKYPDALAYFYYWNQPLNGPDLKNGARNTPVLTGPSEVQKAFLGAAAATYPRMANFSFDCGNAHWTVLDSNPYVNWSDPTLRKWVADDLAKAKGATWRFVAFHHPPFNSASKHRDDQQMRVLCDVFEKGSVDMVWSGHVHNYQRTLPLTFKADAKGRDDQNRVQGEWILDKNYDGNTRQTPRGIIYVITGAGGADLYDPEIQQKPADWLPFTQKYVAETHSFSQVDIDGRKLTVRQISEDGKEIDTFSLTK